MPEHGAATQIHMGAYVQSSDPGATTTRKMWVDTSSGPPYALKVRNAGDSAWETVGSVGGGSGAAYSVDIGDGTSTSYTVTHGFNTKDVVVSVQDKSTGEIVDAHILASTVNTVVLSAFTSVPTTNQYRVTVQAGGVSSTSLVATSSTDGLVRLGATPASSSHPVAMTLASGGYDAATQKILNMVDPASAQDAATKHYVDTHGGYLYATSIGDGAATQYDVVHNLGTLDVIVEVRLVSTGEQVIVANIALDTNTVRLNFATAPTTNSYRVLISGSNTTLTGTPATTTGNGIVELSATPASAPNPVVLVKASGGFDAASTKIINVSDPTPAANDALNVGWMGQMIGGIMPFRLPNASIQVLSLNNAGSGDSSALYTCPSNKRALVLGVMAYNSAGTSTNLNQKIRVSSTNYICGGAVAISAGTFNSITAYPIVLAVGEGLVVNTSQAGLNIQARVIEFDDTGPLKTYKLLSVSTGDNTLYTVPASHKAYVMPANIGQPNGAGACFLTNSSGGTRTFKFHHVTAAGSAGTGNQMVGTTATNGNTTGYSAFGAMGAGDFLVYNTDVGTATQVVWVNVIEV